MFESILKIIGVISLSVRSADIAIIQLIQSAGSFWYYTAWTLSAIIGSMKVLIPASIIALVFIGKRRVALEIFFYSAVTLLVIIGLKIFIGEGRPFVDGISSIIRYSLETDFGMPSGHAILSVVVFGWLWFRHPRTALFRIGSVSLIFLIGLSRIYLGAHYPSQVVAGWMFGLLLLILFRIIDSKLWSPFQKKLR